MELTSSLLQLAGHSHLSPRCHILSHPSPIPVVLAAFITAGILASYLPQHHKIISRRSANGLSPWWVLLGGLSSIAAIGNILVLPASREDMACCRSIGLGSCIAALLGVAQIGTQVCCFMVIVTLFLIYSSPSTVSSPSSVTSLSASASTPKMRSANRNAVLVSSIIWPAFFVVGFVSLLLVSIWPRHTQTWADILGTVAGSLAAVQYLPQIYHTYRLKSVASLSLLTMMIQSPGSFLFALSLWLRVGWEGWSAWLVYIVTGLLQAALMGLALFYHYRATPPLEQGSNEINAGDDRAVDSGSTAAYDQAPATPSPNESTSLLGNGNAKHPSTSHPTHGT